MEPKQEPQRRRGLGSWRPVPLNSPPLLDLKEVYDRLAGAVLNRHIHGV